MEGMGGVSVSRLSHDGSMDLKSSLFRLGKSEKQQAVRQSQENKKTPTASGTDAVGIYIIMVIVYVYV